MLQLAYFLRGESVDQRICKFCSLNAVEDEKHVMLDSELYNAISEIVFFVWVGLVCVLRRTNS